MAESPTALVAHKIGLIRPMLDGVAAQNTNIARFMSVATREAKAMVAQYPDVNVDSILMSVYNAAKVGLEVNGMTGDGYLVAFRTKVKGEYVRLCQFIPGYRGVLRLLREADTEYKHKLLTACVVYSEEINEGRFDLYEDETGQRYTYKPILMGERGAPAGVLTAFEECSTGKRLVQFTQWSHIQKVKRRAMARTDGKGPWSTDEEAMAIKTGIKAHSKLLPVYQSDRFARAMGLEETLETGKISPVPEELVGVVDAEYQDIAAEASKSEHDRPTKPDLGDAEPLAIESTETPPEAPGSTQQGKPPKGRSEQKAGNAGGRYRPAAKPDGFPLFQNACMKICEKNGLSLVRLNEEIKAFGFDEMQKVPSDRRDDFLAALKKAKI